MKNVNSENQNKRSLVGKLQSNVVVNDIPFQDISIDYIGPILPSRGFKYILVATCRVTKFCFARPFRFAIAKSTTKFLLKLI